MKKILITGSFEGAVNLTYGESGVGIDAFPPLLHVDFSAAKINDTQKLWLMGRIPARYGPVVRQTLDSEETIGFEQAFTDKLKVIVEDMELDFEQDFWWPYGKLINKKRVLAIWDKMSKTNRVLAVVRLAAYPEIPGAHGVRQG